MMNICKYSLFVGERNSLIVTIGDPLKMSKRERERKKEEIFYKNI